MAPCYGETRMGEDWHDPCPRSETSFSPLPHHSLLSASHPISRLPAAHFTLHRPIWNADRLQTGTWIQLPQTVIDLDTTASRWQIEIQKSPHSSQFSKTMVYGYPLCLIHIEIHIWCVCVIGSGSWSFICRILDLPKLINGGKYLVR